jgi:hypothetical protein
VGKNSHRGDEDGEIKLDEKFFMVILYFKLYFTNGDKQCHLPMPHAPFSHSRTLVHYGN